METNSLENKTVLVIEDHPVVLEAVVDILEQMGCRTITATNGHEGIERALETTPDLILSNFQMPEANGLEVLEAVRVNPRTARIPFVIMTAAPTSALQSRSIQIGANAFLEKEIDGSIFINTIARVIEEADGGREMPTRQHDS